MNYTTLGSRTVSPLSSQAAGVGELPDHPSPALWRDRGAIRTQETEYNKLILNSPFNMNTTYKEVFFLFFFLNQNKL